MKRLFFLLMLLLASSICIARNIPLNSLEGEVSPMDFPYIKINGKQFRLSPGATFTILTTLLSCQQDYLHRQKRFINSIFKDMYKKCGW